MHTENFVKFEIENQSIADVFKENKIKHYESASNGDGYIDIYADIIEGEWHIEDASVPSLSMCDVSYWLQNLIESLNESKWENGAKKEKQIVNDLFRNRIDYNSDTKKYNICYYECFDESVEFFDELYDGEYATSCSISYPFDKNFDESFFAKFENIDFLDFKQICEKSGKVFSSKNKYIIKAGDDRIDYRDNILYETNWNIEDKYLGPKGTFEIKEGTEYINCNAIHYYIDKINKIVIPSTFKAFVDIPLENTDIKYDDNGEKVKLSKGKMCGKFFNNFKELKNIVVNPKNENFCAIDDVLFSKEDKELLVYPGLKNTKKYVVPKEVEKIYNFAFEFYKFEGNPFLEEVVFEGDSVSFGYRVFQKCKNLKKVVLPKNIPIMDVCVFDACESLETVNLPEGLKEIPGGTFYCCKNINNVKIPSSIKNIGYGSFKSCKSLDNIELPEGLEVIEENAFQYVDKLKEITLPKSLKRLEKSSLSCKELRKAIFLCDDVELDEDVFLRCKKLTIYCHENSTAEEYAIENNINYEIL